jgi:hypothetical protein
MERLGHHLRAVLSTAMLTLGALRRQRLVFLAPLVFLLLLIALVLAALGSLGPLAPFVYPLL